MSSYYLMNKNNILATFEVINNAVCMGKIYSKIPNEASTSAKLNSWLISRLSPFTRYNIVELMKICKIHNIDYY